MSIVVPPPPDFNSHGRRGAGVQLRHSFAYVVSLPLDSGGRRIRGREHRLRRHDRVELAPRVRLITPAPSSAVMAGSRRWDPSAGLAMIVGTLETSVIALVIAVVIGLGTSISIVFLLPRRFRNIVATLVELLAAVPSVVYGLWGFLVLAPWMLKTVIPWLNSWPFAKEIVWQRRPRGRSVTPPGVDRARGDDPADVRRDQPRGDLGGAQ